MKTTRNTDQAGGYTVCGYTKGDKLVAYTVTNHGSGWTVYLVYGQGAQLTNLYRTKAAAVQAITNQA
jgi:hypothetical protein